MTAPVASRQLRLPHWPFIVLVPLVAASLWLLDGHQPSPWPDATAPWFTYTTSLSPGARLVDWANASLSLTPDLAPASVLVLLLLGLSTLATLLAARVSPVLALGVTSGLLTTRTVWSTVTPGTDALPLLLVSLAIGGLFSPGRRLLALAAAGLGVPLAAPTAAWALAPAVAGRARGRGRAVASLAVLAVGMLATMLLLRAAWTALPCLAADAWPTRLRQVLQPGLSAAVSPLLALRQFAAVLIGDVHLFGVVGAIWGACTARHTPPGFGRTTAAALALTAVAVVAGFLPPALAAALLLPWWAPWFAVGVGHFLPGSGPRRALATVVLAALAVASPLLRVVQVIPEPWAAALPATTRAVAATLPSTALFTSDSGRRLRLWRSNGVATMPLDSENIATCAATRYEVHATGDSVGELERAGLGISGQPLYAPFASVLADVRSRQLVAVALSSSALPYAGPHGLAALTRLGLHGAPAVATTQVGVVAMTDAAGARTQVSRGGLEVRVRPDDRIGTHVMPSALVVDAQPGAVTIDNPPRTLVQSATGAIAVFDRLQGLTFRATTGAAPGLPVLLTSLDAWRHVVVDAGGTCQDGREEWTTVDGAPRRISVPTLAASRQRPVRIYLAADELPRPAVTGLPIRSTGPDWLVSGFDRQHANDEAGLRAAAVADELPLSTLPASRHVVRIELRPSEVRPPARVSVSAGVQPRGWLVAGSRGPTPQARRICQMADGGDRMLGGQFGTVDDESDRELTVWARDGWHRAESGGDHAFQWSAVATPSVAFRLVRPVQLVLAMDAVGASLGGRPQPVRVRVNGTWIEPSWQGVGRAVIPAELLRAGENILELSVSQAVQPPGDARTLGVLVRQLRLIRASRQ